MHDKLFDANGIVYGEDNALHIGLDAENAGYVDMSHELMHELELHAPEVYAKASKYLREKAGDDVAKFEKKVERLYKSRGMELNESKHNSEVDALLAEQLFSDNSFLDRIINDSDPAHAEAKRTLLTKIKERAFDAEKVIARAREEFQSMSPREAAVGEVAVGLEPGKLSKVKSFN